MPPFGTGTDSQTVPCDKFLRYAKNYVRTRSAPSAYRSNSLAAQSSNGSQVLSMKPIQTTSKLPYSVPTFIDPALTGCYAHTGGTTAYQVESGRYAYDAANVSQVPDIMTENQTMTYQCSDFMRFTTVPLTVIESFMKSPTCTSYLGDYHSWKGDWIYPPQKLLPPGVINEFSIHTWPCCDFCSMSYPKVQVLYFSTASVIDCTAHKDPVPTAPSYATYQGHTLSDHLSDASPKVY